MKKLILLLFPLLVLSCSPQVQKNTEGQAQNKLLLVSFDGFRADYLSKTDTPNFDSLAAKGITSEGLIPVFPSNTFPNYYAIVTGLYPENNGLISNNMYDPVMDAHYSLRDRSAVQNPDWYEGEPIWNTAEKQGLNAGTMFWVGSAAPVQGMRPTFWKSYDGSMSDSARIDTVLKWMSLDNEEEIDLGTLYFSFTDSRGHRFGPDSPEMVEAIKRADELAGYLVQQLRNKDLFHQTNLMIVSDHGMEAVSRDRVVLLDEIIEMDKVAVIEYSPSVMMNVDEEHLNTVFEKLKKNEGHYKVYRKAEIPERYHLKNHRRTPDLLLVADLGYTLTTSDYLKSRKDYATGGAHGFDNQNKNMHAFFIAYGPDLKSGLRIGTIENTELYNLMARLLNLEPAPNDGNMQNVNSFIVN